MLKLSKASKMPCRSWSLPAIRSCPAAKKRGGELVDACKGCYATEGNYMLRYQISWRETLRLPFEHVLAPLGS